MIQKSFRSAKTGRFVTSKFAKKHKATTYLDKIKKKKVCPKPSKKDSDDEWSEW